MLYAKIWARKKGEKAYKVRQSGFIDTERKEQADKFLNHFRTKLTRWMAAQGDDYDFKLVSGFNEPWLYPWNKGVTYEKSDRLSVRL